MEPSPETREADAIVEEESVKTVEASPGALPFMEETCSSAAKERQEEKGESEMKNGGGGGDAPTCLQTQHTFEANDFLWYVSQFSLNSCSSNSSIQMPKKCCLSNQNQISSKTTAIDPLRSLHVWRYRFQLMRPVK